jgi:hypothetical protein
VKVALSCSRSGLTPPRVASATPQATATVSVLPLHRRTIQREIEDALSEQILLNQLHAGQIVVIDCEGDPDDPDNARLVFITSDSRGTHHDGGTRTALTPQ